MHKNYNYTKTILLTLILIIFLIDYCTGQTSLKRPNVILILADDMGYGDISAFNGGLNSTPTLDKLSKESVFFTQAYSGSPVCTPSRAALLTGRYPHRTGAITLNMELFPELTRIHEDEITIADVFSTNGYATGLIGKWHSGDGEEYHPMRRGFQEFEGFKGYDVPKNYFNYKLDINGQYQEISNNYLTENLTQRAIGFVNRHKNEPFFLHLAHYAPHRPLSAPKALIDSYLKKGFDQNTATVYAMIEIMDKGIGDLISELQRLRIRNNTIIIFASDNGPDPIVGPRFNQALKGTKYTVDEGGIHVPLLFNWPKALSPKSIDKVAHFTDIMPTLIEECRLKFTENIRFDGGSLSGLLYGVKKENDLPKYRFWQWNRGVPYYSHNAAIRDGDWKLVRPFSTRNMVFGQSLEKPQLFNIKNDPSEKMDLSDKEPGKFNTMNVKLEKWCREVEWERLSKQ